MRLEPAFKIRGRRYRRRPRVLRPRVRRKRSWGSHLDDRSFSKAGCAEVGIGLGLLLVTCLAIGSIVASTSAYRDVLPSPHHSASLPCSLLSQTLSFSTPHPSPCHSSWSIAPPVSAQRLISVIFLGLYGRTLSTSALMNHSGLTICPHIAHPVACTPPFYLATVPTAPASPANELAFRASIDQLTLRGDFTASTTSMCSYSTYTRDSGACSAVHTVGPQASSALSAVHTVGPRAFENSESIKHSRIDYVIGNLSLDWRVSRCWAHCPWPRSTVVCVRPAAPCGDLTTSCMPFHIFLLCAFPSAASSAGAPASCAALSPRKRSCALEALPSPCGLLAVDTLASYPLASAGPLWPPASVLLLLPPSGSAALLPSFALETELHPCGPPGPVRLARSCYLWLLYPLPCLPSARLSVPPRPHFLNPDHCLGVAFHAYNCSGFPVDHFVIMIKWYRIGEALHPGPYTVGGSSSSSRAGPEAGHSPQLSLAGQLPCPLGRPAQHPCQGESSMVHHRPCKGRSLVSREVTRPEVEGSLVAAGSEIACGFDDPDAWDFGPESEGCWPPLPLVEPWVFGRTLHDESSCDQGGFFPPEVGSCDADTLQLNAEGVCGDYEWNQKLDSIGLTRNGLSPIDIASRWRDRQEAEKVAVEWALYEKEWESMERHQGPELPECFEAEALSAAVQWSPPIEKNPKKAAKWRSRARMALKEGGGVGEPSSPESAHPSGWPTSPAAEAAPPCDPLPPRKSAENRGRSARGSRRSKILVVYTMNTTGKPAALKALEALSAKAKTVAAVALQEHHCLTDAVPDLQHQACKIGWNLHAVPATIKNDGPSAGVALATPKHVPAAATKLIQLDLSPDASPGRLAGLWVQAGIPGGMLVVSVYLWHSEGMTSRNLDILLTALAAVKAHGGPWLIVGDFNCPPSVLQNALHPTLSAAGAVVVSTSTPTHYPGGGLEPAILDYGIVDDRIANTRVVRSIELDLDLSIGKHRAVRVNISNKGHVSYVTRILKPKAFPRKVPIGCARRPVDAPGTVEHNGVDKFYADTVACAEAEIGRLHDVVNKEGFVRDEFVGRDRGFRTRKELLLPARTRSSIGEAGLDAQLLKWINERLTELRHSAKLNDEGVLTLAAWKQSLAIQRRFRLLAKDKAKVAILAGVDSRWPTWLEDVVAWDFDSVPTVLQIPLEHSWEQGNLLAAKHYAAAKKRWVNWVKDKVKNGASAIHTFTKRTVTSPIVLQGTLDSFDASPQGVLEADQKMWQEVWTRLDGKHGAPWRDWSQREVDQLAPITLGQVRKAARTFSSRTAVGEDWIHPRSLVSLSDSVLQRYVDVLNHAEAVGDWPGLITTNLVHLIPKPVGGRRPIGLMATLIRLYERVRRHLIVEWRATRNDNHNYMVGGKSAEDAVWCQSVRDEAVRENGLVSASVLLDLVKAFECVRLDVIWRAAMRTGFPLAVLRLSLQAYCRARRLVYRGVVGDPVLSLNAILAGGGLATDMLGLLLMDTLEMLKEELPKLHLFVVVDDLTLRVEGHPTEVAAQLIHLTSLCIDDLENVLDMKVSRGKKWELTSDVKSVAMASSPEARRFLTIGMKAMGIPVQRHARNLGVDYGPGVRVKRKVVMLNRWSKVRAKVKRCRKIGAAAAATVGRTALLPALAYGAACTSVPTGLLKDIRGVMAQMYGSMNGRSTTARLAVRATEPSYSLILAPLRAWWKAVWDGILPPDILQAAIRGASRTAEGAGHLRHCSVEGGAGAFLSSLSRIGWRARGIDEVVTVSGLNLKLGEDCDPKMLLRLARKDLEAAIAADSDLAATLTSIATPDGYHRASSQVCGFVPIGTLLGQLEQAQEHWWAEFKHCNGKLVPWLKPAIDALKAAKKDGFASSTISSFASLIEGGWWTQSRLHFCGLASDPFCRWCGISLGTLWHRIAGRCHLKGEAEHEEAILEAGRRRWWDPLFSRCIPAVPLAPLPSPVCTWSFPDNADQLIATGDIYTDGALRGLHPEARRAGWAFAMVNAESQMIKLAYWGTCNEPWLSVLRAELKAIEEALRRAVAPVVIYTDSSVAVDAFRKGRAFACSSKADGADIWYRIWGILRDFGDFDLRKVKAHTTAQDVAEGLISPTHQAGNAAADYFAVSARKSAEKQSPIRTYDLHYARARAWYRVVLTSIADWKADLLGDVEDEEVERGITESLPDPPCSLATRKHTIWALNDQWVCRACGQHSSGDLNPRLLAKKVCKGAMYARMLGSLGVLQDPSAFFCHTVREMEAAGAKPWVCDAEARILPEAVAPLSDQASSGLPPVRRLRRITGKQPDPSALPPSSSASSVREQESGHLLVKAGRFTFCDRCGRWAIDRMSPGLRRKCTGTVDTAAGAYRVRRERLRCGRHPLSNAPIG